LSRDWNNEKACLLIALVLFALAVVKLGITLATDPARPRPATTTPAPFRRGDPNIEHVLDPGIEPGALGGRRHAYGGRFRTAHGN